MQAEAEAEALDEVFSEVLETQFATKADIARLEGELKLIKCMVGLVIWGPIGVNSEYIFFISWSMGLRETFSDEAQRIC